MHKQALIKIKSQITFCSLLLSRGDILNFVPDMNRLVVSEKTNKYTYIRKGIDDQL